MKYSFKNNIPFDKAFVIVFPFGIDLYSSGFLTFGWKIVFHTLSILTTNILTYNIQILLNLLLNGLIVYLLVYKLSKNTLASYFSGLVFAFGPYQFSRIWQHLGLTYNQWIPFTLFFAISLKETPNIKSKLFFILSIVILFSFEYSVTYFGLVVLASFLFFVILHNLIKKIFIQKDLLKRDFVFIKNFFLFGLIALIIISPQLFPLVKKSVILSSNTPASAHNPFHRAFEDLFSQSARPLSYFLPATVHPIFGKFTENFIGSPLYGESFTEHTLYLGWTPLVLAFIAFRKWKKRRKEKKLDSLGTVPFRDSPHREDFYIGFFVFLAIVGWLFSQPPWWNILGLKIYMPSFFMYKILPMFRAYCRFGIVVMLAVAVLAGFGLKFILERLKSNKSKIAITTLVCGLVLFEFWNWPPYKIIDVSKVPAVYYWLNEQPEDIIIAEYPLDINGPNELFKFFQTKHEKKIINGTIPGTYANKVAQTITKLSEPKTVGVLKWMGVKYVLVHREDYLKTELTEEIEELTKIPNNYSLKFIKSFPAQECPREDIMCVQKTGPIDVYEVIASPIKLEIE